MYTTYGASQVGDALTHFQNFRNWSDVKCQCIVTVSQSASDKSPSPAPQPLLLKRESRAG